MCLDSHSYTFLQENFEQSPVISAIKKPMQQTYSNGQQMFTQQTCSKSIRSSISIVSSSLTAWEMPTGRPIPSDNPNTRMRAPTAIRKMITKQPKNLRFWIRLGLGGPLESLCPISALNNKRIKHGNKEIRSTCWMCNTCNTCNTFNKCARLGRDGLSHVVYVVAIMCKWSHEH